MIGTLLGNYRVLNKLGEGGMGVVYVGRHEALGHPVAVKVLQPELSRDGEMVKRFFNEAHAATAIRHPGIVQIFDFGHSPDGAAYFVMELLEGMSLAARLHQRRLTYAECCRLGRQAANVLQAAHARGITHRDLKPDNLFLVPDPEVAGGERVKVLDFGIAKLAGEVQSLGVKTHTGLVMGTPLYMSPEQCRGASAVDARSDIYSLGCILFEMVGGRPPFVGESMGAIIGAQQYVEPPPPWTIVPDVPPPLAQLIMHMLAKAPEARPPTMAAVGQALDEILATLGEAPRRAATPFPPLQAPATTLGGAAGTLQTAPPRRSRLPLVLGGLLGAGAIAAVAVIAAQGGGSGAGDPPGSAAAPGDDPAPKLAAPAGSGAAPSEPGGPGAAPAAPLANPWIPIAPPRPPIAIGLLPRRRDEYPRTLVGLRPSRKVTSPAAPYELQQHEVTWGELGPWLASRKLDVPRPAWVAADPAQRDRLPATNVPWKLAAEYCASLGGALPTEAQWELAARGAERRPYAWGSDQLDRLRTRALGGPGAVPQPVLASTQDRTPEGVHDLIGNVQEWTADLWIEDAPGQDESWVKDGETTFRAVRGLPLRGTGQVPDEGAAYREPLCATGTCSAEVSKIQELIGFRCARTKESAP